MRRPSKNQPFLEELEDRTVPTTFSIPWPDAENLTFSFAQDGAEIGHEQNELFQHLDAKFDTQAWQTELLRAFQTWAVQINANIGLVSDSGAAFGAIGLTQNDPRFGDIRIAAFEQGNDIVANNVPYQLAAGSWSGDVFLNTAANFTIGDPSGYDLFSVMLNEAGNVFGLEDTYSVDSAMYTDYAGIRSGLASIDISRIQDLYGARSADQYEGWSGNDQHWNATRISAPLIDLSSEVDVLKADITTQDDVDYYKVRAPLNSHHASITLKTEGVSLLVGKMSIYNQFGHLVETVEADSIFAGDLSVRFCTFPGMTYYIKVEGATDDVFGIGAYQLHLDFESLGEQIVDTGEQVVDDVELIDRIFTDAGLVNDEQNTNDTIDTATVLQTPSGYDEHTRYEAVESLSTTTDVDYFRFRTPATESPIVLVTIGSLGEQDLDFRISVFDQDHNAIKANVYRTLDGDVQVELQNADANADYYLKITSMEGSEAGGNYFVIVDSGAGSVEMQHATAGSLDQSNIDQTGNLRVNKSQLFRFDLSGIGELGDNQAIQMTIYDADRNAVFTLSAISGQLKSRYIWLNRGDYVVRFTQLTRGTTPAGRLDFSLQLAGLSDDVGPTSDDPSQNPVEDPAHNDPPPPEDTYTWEDPSTWEDGSQPQAPPPTDGSGGGSPPPPGPASSGPANDQPANDQPANDQPANDQPANDQPSDYPPADEQPADNPPADDHPGPPQAPPPTDGSDPNDQPPPPGPEDSTPPNQEPANEPPPPSEPSYPQDSETNQDPPPEPSNYEPSPADEGGNPEPPPPGPDESTPPADEGPGQYPESPPAEDPGYETPPDDPWTEEQQSTYDWESQQGDW